MDENGWLKLLTILLSVHLSVSPQSQSRMSSLEEELLVKDRTLKSIQNEMTQTKKELAAKELSLQKVSNELSLAQTHMAQDSERVNTCTYTAATGSGASSTTAENKHLISVIMFHIFLMLWCFFFDMAEVLILFNKTFVFPEILTCSLKKLEKWWSFFLLCCKAA